MEPYITIKSPFEVSAGCDRFSQGVSRADSDGRTQWNAGFTRRFRRDLTGAFDGPARLRQPLDGQNRSTQSLCQAIFFTSKKGVK